MSPRFGSRAAATGSASFPYVQSAESSCAVTVVTTILGLRDATGRKAGVVALSRRGVSAAMDFDGDASVDLLLQSHGGELVAGLTDSAPALTATRAALDGTARTCGIRAPEAAAPGEAVLLCAGQPPPPVGSRSAWKDSV